MSELDPDGLPGASSSSVNAMQTIAAAKQHDDCIGDGGFSSLDDHQGEDETQGPLTTGSFHLAYLSQDRYADDQVFAPASAADMADPAEDLTVIIDDDDEDANLAASTASFPAEAGKRRRLK